MHILKTTATLASIHPSIHPQTLIPLPPHTNIRPTLLFALRFTVYVCVESAQERFYIITTAAASFHPAGASRQFAGKVWSITKFHRLMGVSLKSARFSDNAISNIHKWTISSSLHSLYDGVCAQLEICLKYLKFKHFQKDLLKARILHNRLSLCH